MAFHFPHFKSGPDVNPMPLSQEAARVWLCVIRSLSQLLKVYLYKAVQTFTKPVSRGMRTGPSVYVLNRGKAVLLLNIFFFSLSLAGCLASGVESINGSQRFVRLIY